ncbi:MAG: glycosyl transferase family 1 [Chloroflexi bacterium]|nr:MAG: glycosyl transferase family 1 [Chloroflexota bacterium]RLC87823.1 MAG: glycosyl transferase family 1 [Chloroflexota bacterium]
MRILMISKSCVVGAYQRKLEEIARFPDIELMVVVPPAWRDGTRLLQLERAHTKGYDLVVEPITFNGNFHLHFYPRLGQRLRAFAPDIVHVDEEPYNFATFHALRLAKGFGASALWFTWQNLNRRYPLPFRLIERYNLRHADSGIAGSAGAAAVWREKGYAGPLVTIPQFGVDPDVFSPSLERRDSAHSFVIGYVGRLVPEKGVDLLIEAVAKMKGSWRLVILGGGPEQGRLEELVRRLGLNDRVIFEKWLYSLRLPAFYRGLDALVLPSHSQPNWVEQFGRVLTEAMACGVPVIGSNCGEIPQVIGNAGLIFPEDDARALRERLTRLMRDADLWADIARRGRERVLANFTQAQVAAQTVAVYRKMVTDKTKP